MECFKGKIFKKEISKTNIDSVIFDSEKTKENSPIEDALSLMENKSKREVMVKNFDKIAVQIGPFAVNIKLGMLTNFLNWAQKDLEEEQIKQQSKVEKIFENDPSINISSFFNKPDGSGSINIEDELQKFRPEENKLIMLLNGVVNPQDIVQANPKLERVMMACLRIHPVNVAIHGLNAKKIIQGDSIPDYIINTIKTTHEKIFENENLNVLVVRNSSTKNLLDTIKAGGEKTVLVVGGHGDFGTLSMTDKSITSEDVPSPEKKLKAFIQHTCALKKDKKQEEMGKRFSQKTFGWKRLTSPLDFIEEPLKSRNIDTDSHA